MVYFVSVVYIIYTSLPRAREPGPSPGTGGEGQRAAPQEMPNRPSFLRRVTRLMESRSASSRWLYRPESTK